MGASEIFITNATVYTPFQEIRNGNVYVKDGKIASVSSDGNSPVFNTKAQVIDASDLMVVPGFIDIHVHGGGGYDVMDRDFDGLQEIARVHATGGTTSLLGSTWAVPYEDLAEVCRVFSSAMKEKPKGARLLGMHLEGSYIAPEKRGAQNLEYIKLPDFEEFQSLYNVSSGNIKRITIAPELKGAFEFIEKAAQMGVEVSIGHTSGTYEDALKAIKAGATSITHLFNVMNPIHHREPGVVGAALLSDVKVEIIADGIHLHPEILKLVSQLKTKDMILVTDSIRATGMPDGEYEGGGQRIVVKDGIARIPEGNLAGSTLAMNNAVRNMTTWAGVDILKVLQMCTVNPAVLLGVYDVMGSLELGKYGDLVIMDKEYNVRFTIVGGEVVYEAP